jgi:hypothetical protein
MINGCPTQRDFRWVGISNFSSPCSCVQGGELWNASSFSAPSVVQSLLIDVLLRLQFLQVGLQPCLVVGIGHARQ